VRIHWIAELKDVVLGFRPATTPFSSRPKGSLATRNGKQFAETHLIVDFPHSTNLDDVERIKGALVEAVRATGASLLHIHLHRFSGIGGVSGVAVLAERTQRSVVGEDGAVNWRGRAP
jgi:S-adenosylmethionine decarboxylase